MKNLTVIQIAMFLIGSAMVFVSSDGTWESANLFTYIGMGITILGILLNFIVGFIMFIIDKWK
jgi:hypothetical protein